MLMYFYCLNRGPVRTLETAYDSLPDLSGRFLTYVRDSYFGVHITLMLL